MGRGWERGLGGSWLPICINSLNSPVVFFPILNCLSCLLVQRSSVLQRISLQVFTRVEVRPPRFPVGEGS